MNWLARQWLTAGLRRLGHRPEWRGHLDACRLQPCGDLGRGRYAADAAGLPHGGD